MISRSVYMFFFFFSRIITHEIPAPFLRRSILVITDLISAAQDGSGPRDCGRADKLRLGRKYFLLLLPKRLNLFGYTRRPAG